MLKQSSPRGQAEEFYRARCFICSCQAEIPPALFGKNEVPEPRGVDETKTTVDCQRNSFGLGTRSDILRKEGALR